MNKLEIIRQGESLDFNFTLNDPTESISNWTCTISVKEKPDDAALISRVVTPNGNSWPGFLTQTETSALPPLAKGAAYYLIALKQNTTIDKEEQETVRFRVTKAWA